MATATRPPGTRRVEINMPEDLLTKLTVGYPDERGNVTKLILAACELYATGRADHARQPNWLTDLRRALLQADRNLANADAYVAVGKHIADYVFAHAPR